VLFRSLVSALMALSLSSVVNAQTAVRIFLGAPGGQAVLSDPDKTAGIFYITAQTGLTLNSNTVTIQNIPAGASCVAVISTGAVSSTPTLTNNLSKLSCTAAVQSISVTSITFKTDNTGTPTAIAITTSSGSYSLPQVANYRSGMVASSVNPVSFLPAAAVVTKTGKFSGTYTVSFASPISCNAVFNNSTWGGMSC